MLIKKNDVIYSVEKIVRKNIYSESQKGNLFLHSRFIYVNPVRLDTDNVYSDVIIEKTFYVSPRRAFDIRYTGRIGFDKAPVEGNFILKNEVHLFCDSNFKVLSDIIEKSKRDITTQQLEEIRTLGNYNIEFENENYWFIKLSNCPIEQRNEFRFFNIDTLKKFREFVIMFKPVDRFFLKIPLKNIKKYAIGKARCGDEYHIYEIENDGAIRELCSENIEKNGSENEIEINGKKYKVKYVKENIKLNNEYHDVYVGVMNSDNQIYVASYDSLEDAKTKILLLEISYTTILKQV